MSVTFAKDAIKQDRQRLVQHGVGQQKGGEQDVAVLTDRQDTCCVILLFSCTGKLKDLEIGDIQ